MIATATVTAGQRSQREPDSAVVMARSVSPASLRVILGKSCVNIAQAFLCLTP